MHKFSGPNDATSNQTSSSNGSSGGAASADQATKLDGQARQEIATALERAVAKLSEHADADAARAAVLKAAGSYGKPAQASTAGSSDWEPAPLALDFNSEPPTPDWIVNRLIERGTVVLLSGDTGAAKSICVDALAVAVCYEDDWLGHETHAQRVLVVDEENPERIVHSRLRALGMQNEERDRLRYFNREGFALGDGGASDTALRAQLEEFAPDLVIVDTAMAACDLNDVNDNGEAVRLLKHMRGLAREFGCAFVILHHERKRSKEHPSSSGQAMMGARQWAGQADAHMTLTVESELVKEEAEEPGHHRYQRTFKWRPAEKDRDGAPNIPQRVAVTSEKDEGGRLVWMWVENEGEIQDAPSETAALAATLGTLAQQQDEAVTTGRLALLAGRDAQNIAFKRALKEAESSGYIEKVKRGVWGPGAEKALEI